MMIKRIAIAAALLLAMTAAAAAQCTGSFLANQFCGSLTGGTPGPRLISSSVINMQAGTVLGNPGVAAAAGADLRAPVLGLNGAAQGSLGLRGSGTGTVTIQPGDAAAGTYNFNLPTAAGSAGLALLSGGGGAAAQTYAILGLPAGGTNAALIASNGGLVYSDASALAILAGTATAGQIPRSGASAAPSWSTATYPATATQGSILAAGTANVISATPTPVLGIPGTTMGTLRMAGSGSGTVTITPQSAAGTITLTLPNTTGTFAVGATTPLVLSATTGTLTCPTCVTSSGGGAITGTAPISVSAAGVVSITSPLPLTNGGSNASLTASNGGVVYSTASALAILAGTATANQHLASGASGAPTWTTATYPATTAAGTVLASGSANIITASATPTLGIAGSVLGSITLSGNSSGTLLIRPAAAAGGWTLTLPDNDGNNGEVLSTNGSGTTTWISAGGTGTITTLTAGTGIAFSSGATCTTTCTVSLTAARQTLPTVQSCGAGLTCNGTSQTYTRPSADVLWIEVLLVGAGGGGSGSGANGTAGGDTCWKATATACTSPLYAAGGGQGSAGAGVGGLGGTVSGTGTCTTAVAGGNGGGSSVIASMGSMGGNSSLGGGGGGAPGGGATGTSGQNQTGGGGGGGSSIGAAYQGGGAGATCYVIINSPASTYAYQCGAAGGGGAGGGAGGGTCYIRVTEHYGS